MDFLCNFLRNTNNRKCANPISLSSKHLLTQYCPYNLCHFSIFPMQIKTVSKLHVKFNERLHYQVNENAEEHQRNVITPVIWLLICHFYTQLCLQNYANIEYLLSTAIICFAVCMFNLSLRFSTPYLKLICDQHCKTLSHVAMIFVGR